MKRFLLTALLAGFLISAGLHAQKVYKDNNGRVILDLTVEAGMPAGAITTSVKTWTSTPSNNGGPMPNNNDKGTINATVYQKLEIATQDTPGTMSWSTAFNECKWLSGNWRLPTLRELMLIYIFKPALESFAGFGVFSETTYWSATEINHLEAWYVSFANGITYPHLKTNSYHARCVREVTPPPEPNCYMVAPGSQTLRIPVSNAIYAGGMADNASFSAQKLWDDNSVVTSVSTEGSGSTGYITVNVHASNQGNALVALKVGTDIYWSWHIWVTNYNPATPTSSNSWTYNGYTFMDRNLGATANDFSDAARGLFYQWGRKDPMPKTDILEFSIVAGPVDQTTAYRNPDKFYTGGNWLNTQVDNLWGHEASKSVYDPCPAGWRVPSFKGTVFPWQDLTTTNFAWQGTNTGRQYTGAATTSKYPASGYRNFSNGTLNNVASNGYYWSASPYSTHAYYLNFNSGSVYPASHYYRALGFSVRCARE